MVLYNVKNRQLFFIEVKRLNDKRWNSPDEINRQMKKYKELIKNEKEKIVTCYSKTIGYYNKLTCVDIPEIDLNKPILLALAITEYKKSEQDRKKRDIAKRVIDKDYVILERGSFLKVSENTIDKWAKTASEKLGFN